MADTVGKAVNGFQLTLACLLIACPAAQGGDEQSEGSSRGLAVENRNENAPFMVRVSVDHADHIYQIGDVMHVSVRSEQPGYLYLFYIDANDQVAVVFPNELQQDNRIAARQVISVPAPDSPFRFRIEEPPGKEILKAVVSRQPLMQLDLDRLQRAALTTLTKQTFEQSEVTLKEKHASTEWAEHSIPIRVTRGPDEQAGAVERAQVRRRHLIAVGVSRYQDPGFSSLRTPRADVTQFVDLMHQKGRISSSRVLLDEAATLEAVRAAAVDEAARKTRPGDTIFIYWSGHGTTIADTSGDEADGFDECLVTYDSSVRSARSIEQSVLTDDRFGRWLQHLDGRRIFILLDACYSGGHSAREKSIETAKSADFQILDDEVVRAKDLGQKDLVLIASGGSGQLSFERPDGSISVMTAELIALMQRKNRLDVAETFQHLVTSVPQYVKLNIPGAEPQIPVHSGSLQPRSS